jgi:hypothetical protein
VGDLLAAVRDRALKRPWLLAPPLLGLLAQNVAVLLGGGAVALQMLLTAVLTSAVTAIFAELWIGDGWSVDGARLKEAWKLFLLPYPLLLLFGFMTTPFVYWLLHDERAASYSMIGIAVVLGAGKVVAYALGAASALALAHAGEAGGSAAALKAGARDVAANPGWFLRVFLALWLFQEACVYLANQLAPGLLIAGFVTTAFPLLGCVALPLEARRTGALKKP